MTNGNPIRKIDTQLMTKVAIFSALAFMLFFLKIKLPIFPGFLDFELSDVAEVITLLSCGTVPAIFVLLIKNLLMLMRTSSLGVGEIANFTIGCAYLLTLGAVYSRVKGRKGFVIGAISAIIAATVTASLFNYFILIPTYVNVMGLTMDKIIGMSKAANANINDLPSLILYGIVPFNILKSGTYSLCSYLIFRGLEPMLKFLSYRPAERKI